MNALSDVCLKDLRIRLKDKEYVPLMVGGMGVNISTAEMVLAVEKLGGIAHISDAMQMDLSDRLYGTDFTAKKVKRYYGCQKNPDKSDNHFDLNDVREASLRYVGDVMSRATGKGLVFLNCMEKLTYNSPHESLGVRLNAALDAGIDGITLSAGLHLSSFNLMSENKRFNDALLGIVVSSVRALNLFLNRNRRLNRLPDYIVVEGPLAGGHLGFGEDWREFSLEDIVRDVKAYLAHNHLNIPVFAAGGIFTGGEAVRMIKEVGADGVQVATRFTISKECGLPDAVKTAYINAKEDDIEVNHLSATGYLMRMLKSSPAIKMRVPPNCEPYGYMLKEGKCPYLTQWWDMMTKKAMPKPEEMKCCLCTHMKLYNVWTCGAKTFRLKETTVKLPNGQWYFPSAEEIYNDYITSTGDQIQLPKPQTFR